MKYDELAFVNQQLAAMLRDGIPLEGSLRQLCATMQRGQLRDELQALEADLSKGVPFPEAITKRKLPDLYVRMLQVGAKTSDFPGILTLLADYYQHANLTTTRLKGLMVYPVIVLIGSAGMSAWIAFLFNQFSKMLAKDMNWMHTGFRMRGESGPVIYNNFGLWLPPILLTSLALIALIVVSLPALRRELQWRLPAFKEANLSRFASAMTMLLKAGCPLPDSLALLEQMENRTGAAKDIAAWRERCSQGHAKFSEIAAKNSIFPPMFVWLVTGAGEDLATGFQRAAKAYQARAAYRTEVFLYAILPVSLFALGLIILGQIYPLAQLVFGLPRLFS